MSSFLIPNATNTTSGNRYASLDQSEPDSIDFSILGRAGSSGVYSGCAVTTNNVATSVGVAAGIVVLEGTPYVISANSALGLPSAPTSLRFDLIVARVSGGVATLKVVQGDEDATNPTFPESHEVITGTPSSLYNVNFATDVVLASVYRNGGAAVTVAHIVDKRVIVSSTVVYQGAAVPLNNSGRTGDLFFQNPSPPPSDLSSGLYVRASTGEWNDITKAPVGAVGPYVPIGGTVMWTHGAVPSGYLEWDGSVYPVATYPDLAALYTDEFGGDGITTFGVPDSGGLSLRGTTSPSNVGSTVGADSTTLVEGNLPSHAHSLNAHTHTQNHTHTNNHSHGIGNHDHPMPHTHSTNHGHTATTSTTGNHYHSSGELTTPGYNSYNPGDPTGGHAHTGNPGRYVVTEGTGDLGLLSASSCSGHAVEPFNTFGVGLAVSALDTILTATDSGRHEHPVWGFTAYAGNHSHNATVASHVGNSGASSATKTGVDTGTTSTNSSSSSAPSVGITGASSGATSSVGGGASFSNIPASLRVRLIVRAL